MQTFFSNMTFCHKKFHFVHIFFRWIPLYNESVFFVFLFVVQRRVWEIRALYLFCKQWILFFFLFRILCITLHRFFFHPCCRLYQVYCLFKKQSYILFFFSINVEFLISWNFMSFFGSRLSWGKLQIKPATWWFDESVAPILPSDERFARQQSRPTSTAVSHGFVVWESRSPPFGSYHAMLSLIQSPSWEKSKYSDC